MILYKTINSEHYIYTLSSHFGLFSDYFVKKNLNRNYRSKTERKHLFGVVCLFVLNQVTYDVA